MSDRRAESRDARFIEKASMTPYHRWVVSSTLALKRPELVWIAVVMAAGADLAAAVVCGFARVCKRYA